MYPNPYFLEKSMDAHNWSMEKEASTHWWTQPVEANPLSASHEPAAAASPSTSPSSRSPGSDRYTG